MMSFPLDYLNSVALEDTGYWYPLHSICCLKPKRLYRGCVTSSWRPI